MGQSNVRKRSPHQGNRTRCKNRDKRAHHLPVHSRTFVVAIDLKRFADHGKAADGMSSLLENPPALSKRGRAPVPVPHQTENEREWCWRTVVSIRQNELGCGVPVMTRWQAGRLAYTVRSSH